MFVLCRFSSSVNVREFPVLWKELLLLLLLFEAKVEDADKEESNHRGSVGIKFAAREWNFEYLQVNECAHFIWSIQCLVWPVASRAQHSNEHRTCALLRENPLFSDNEKVEDPNNFLRIENSNSCCTWTTTATTTTIDLWGWRAKLVRKGSGRL